VFNWSLSIIEKQNKEIALPLQLLSK